MGERSEFMNSNELKNIIESARISKGISQREIPLLILADSIIFLRILKIL